jgi:catechol 2,3-dioxygenase-like lactoylglutathione lyase family enzyme
VRKAALAFGTSGMLLVLSVCGAAAMQTAETRPGAVTGACQVSPVVSDLDKSARFYRDMFGLDLVPTPSGEGLPWDSNPNQLNLHGLPKARLRFINARMSGVPCGVELVEFGGVDRQSVRRRLQDPGATMLILLVKDIDAIFARLKAANVTVLTKGGAPILVGPSKTARAVIVQDPDGHPIELAQLQPAPSTTANAQSNVIGIRLRITVTDIEKAANYYRQTLGIDLKPGVFTKDESVMAMTGLPSAAEYRVGASTLPGSELVLELIEFKGAGPTKSVPSRVQDPGSYRLQLNVRDLSETLATLRQTGSRVISTEGSALQMMLGSDAWRLAVIQDPNNLFLVVQQRLAP